MLHQFPGAYTSKHKRETNMKTWDVLGLQNSCSGTGILGVLESDQFEDGMHAGHNFLKWSNIDRAVARPISALLYSFSSKNMETPGLSVVSDHVYLGCLSHRYLW